MHLLIGTSTSNTHLHFVNWCNHKGAMNPTRNIEFGNRTLEATSKATHQVKGGLFSGRCATCQSLTSSCTRQIASSDVSGAPGSSVRRIRRNEQAPCCSGRRASTSCTLGSASSRRRRPYTALVTALQLHSVGASRLSVVDASTTVLA